MHEQQDTDIRFYYMTLTRPMPSTLFPYTTLFRSKVGEAYWDVPWRHGRHPHADPEMLRLETNLAAEFGRHYAKDRKSTRLNSSHRCISYAVFCLKKKKIIVIVVWNETFTASVYLA